MNNLRKWEMGVFIRLVLVGVFWLLSAEAMALNITLEPDNYASSTDLSDVSPYVSLSTTGGAPVYAAPIAGTGQVLPPGITDTGPFQERVFSASPDRNSEWFAWPDAAGASVDSYDPDEWAKDPFGLKISFSAPVNYLSLLGLELFPDAGWGGDDPLRWWVYDSSMTLISSDYMDTVPGTGSIGFNPDEGFNYYYWDMQLFRPDIAMVIIGGESEFTTLDRLVFNVTPVPEPGAVMLLAFGLAGLPLACRRRIHKSQSHR